MKRISHVCDRCGIEYDLEDRVSSGIYEYYNCSIKPMAQIEKISDNPENTFSVCDLCPKCFLSFIQWLTGKKEII